MGLLEKLKNAKGEDFLEPTEKAQEILQIAGERVEVIRPTRVIFASISVLLILSAVFIVGTWLVPYDRTSVDVVYIQGGSGHVVLVELNNKGSRSIEDITMDIRFLDDLGVEIARTSFASEEIPAHTSVAGDELELLISGASVWENYTIEITLDYTYGGDSYDERFTHEVGQWTREMFTDKAPIRFF